MVLTVASSLTTDLTGTQSANLLGLSVWQGGWRFIILGVPSIPSHYVILCDSLMLASNTV